MRSQTCENSVNYETKQIASKLCISKLLFLPFPLGTWELVLKTKPRAFYLGINKALFFSLWALQLAYQQSCSRLSPVFSLQTHAADSRGATLREGGSAWSMLACWMTKPVCVCVCVCVCVRISFIHCVCEGFHLYPKVVLANATCVVLATKFRPREEYSDAADIYFFSHTMCKSEKIQPKRPCISKLYFLSFWFTDWSVLA